MSELDRLLDAMPPWVLVGGKGGVGKTTCAAALALRSATRGDETLLLSTDPARSLGDALGESLGGAPARLASRQALWAMQLDPSAAREAFLATWREVLVAILDRGTYLDREDIAGLVDAALPGADEAMALLTLLDLERDGRWARIVVDTAPTGHTLRLLDLPRTFRALVALLDAMQEKHRFMVRALTHRYRGDDADRFLEEMQERVSALERTLTDGRRAAMVLVTRLEPVVAAETVRYLRALAERSVAVAAMVANATPEAGDHDARSALATLGSAVGDLPCAHVPALEDPPIGIAALERWGEAMRPGLPPLAGDATPASSGVTTATARPSVDTLVRPLTIVGGKGGVGKTTVACALGIAAAAGPGRALVVSTDPAPSVADALALAIGDEPVPVAGADRLEAQQLDAAGAFARFRERWQARVDSLFDAVLGGRMEAVHDRRIMRDLLRLAPPGIDELYALASLGETLAEERYATIIVDPAPTGHLLRLLESPALALDWSHRLLRLMLKYRPLTGLGEAAEELLAFAKRTRALDAMLHDEQRAALVLVALDEPLVRRETERLVGDVRARGMAVSGLVWNRAGTGGGSPLPVVARVPQFEAPTTTPPPRGVDALTQWMTAWRPLRDREHG